MKRHIFIAIVAMCAFSFVKANVITHTFRFSESDFEIFATESDSLTIISTKETALYSNPTDPWIPTLGKNIALSANESVKNVTYTLSKRLIRSGVDLKNLKLMLTRTSGIGLYEFDLNALENEATLDISNVQSGMYIISLVENGATLYSFPSRLIVE